MLNRFQNSPPALQSLDQAAGEKEAGKGWQGRIDEIRLQLNTRINNELTDKPDIYDYPHLGARSIIRLPSVLFENSL